MTWVVGYEGLYYANTLGEILAVKRQGSQGGVLKQKTDDKGYKRIILYKDKKPKTFLVHRLIALTYLENPENKRTVNHRDGNPSNNSVENLEWATHTEQMVHSIETLGRSYADRVKPILSEESLAIFAINCRTVGLSNKKTTEEDEDTIYKLSIAGMSAQSIADKLGFISRRTVSRIIKSKLGASE